MAHSKAYMIDNMMTMGTEIMDLLMKEKITIKENALLIPENSEDLRADFIRPGFKWIMQIYETEYKKVKRVKGLLPEELWTRYRKWGGFDDHREVILLRQSLNELRMMIVSRKRPDFYKKKKYEKAKNRISKAKSRSRVSTANSN